MAVIESVVACPVDTLLLRGAPLAARLRAEIAESRASLVAQTSMQPSLVTILVGDDPAALAYRSSIDRTMSRADIRHVPLNFAPAMSPTEFVRLLGQLNADPGVTGILVLMPLPPTLSIDLVNEYLSPLKDVDGITPTNAGRLHLGLPSLHPSTPQGGIELLDFYGIDIAGRQATVIGRSNVVGRPLATLLLRRHATVTICHRQTRDLGAATRDADIIGMAAGCAGLLTPEMVRPGAVVLDFGINVVADGLVGDADFDGLQGVAGAITPVPGGTGPVTSLVLARNTIAAGHAAARGGLDYLAAS